MPTNTEQSAESPTGSVHGQLSYLQIPAVDIKASEAFYATIFGWQVDEAYPSFEAPGLIGQWVTDRPPSKDAGLLAWIDVDRIDHALDLVRSTGGQVIDEPSPDGPNRWLATIRDPAGNTLGIVQHGARR